MTPENLLAQHPWLARALRRSPEATAQLLAQHPHLHSQALEIVYGSQSHAEQDYAIERLRQLVQDAT